MDTLKGKKIMVWTYMGNARMYEALNKYGDRISQIGLFSFKVRASGEIYETGVAVSDMLSYFLRRLSALWKNTRGAAESISTLKGATDMTHMRYPPRCFEGSIVQ